nr:hypothetical protein [uncultured Roseateles sp.]
MFKRQTHIASLALSLALGASPSSAQDALTLRDFARNRDVLVHLYRPKAEGACASERRCPVVLLSPGTGLSHTAYSFLAQALAKDGYLVLAVQHELPTDAPMPNTGHLLRDRSPTWQRGADNLRFASRELASRMPEYRWDQPILLGHSTGGDISALLATQSPGFASTLVTLDHRRMALPRDASLRVLSLRGSDFEADPGVLPSPAEREALGHCIVNLLDARHNDMNDAGPAALKARLVNAVVQFLRQGHCVESAPVP